MSYNDGAIARRKKIRSFLIASLVQAMNATRVTQAAVAKSADVTPATVRRWLAGKTALNVEAVLAAPRLAKAFRRELCTFDHGDSATPYVAKRRGSK